jgi:hypothetical protein
MMACLRSSVLGLSSCAQVHTCGFCAVFILAVLPTFKDAHLWLALWVALLAFVCLLILTGSHVNLRFVLHLHHHFQAALYPCQGADTDLNPLSLSIARPWFDLQDFLQPQIPTTACRASLLCALGAYAQLPAEVTLTGECSNPRTAFDTGINTNPLPPAPAQAARAPAPAAAPAPV